MNRILLSVAVLTLSIGSVDAQDRIYEARRTTSPPTIDGVMTSASEWADASAAQAEWTLLESGGLDPANNRIQMMWDTAGLYLLHQVDSADWQAGRGFGNIDFDYWYLSMYFDPNTDGETNDQTGPLDTGIDGYQIAFNEPLGESGYSVESPDLGLFQEAHVNGRFGNQGWEKGSGDGFSGLEIKQTISSEESYGYTEMFVPWADFDASDPQIYNPAVDDIGLYHPYAPENGEEWFFNIGRDRFFSSASAAWVMDPSSSLLADRPHGILRFVDSGSELACDINQDGTCTGADIDTIAAAIRNGDMDQRLDLTNDGRVDELDMDFLIESSTMFHTYYGDSNLDGQFNSSDFVVVFTAGQYEDGIAGNSIWESGDWNGDTEFDSSDFVQAFQTGGYEVGTRDVALAIPEPSGLASYPSVCSQSVPVDVSQSKHAHAVCRPPRVSGLVCQASCVRPRVSGLVCQASCVRPALSRPLAPTHSRSGVGPGLPADGTRRGCEFLRMGVQFSGQCDFLRTGAGSNCAG